MQKRYDVVEGLNLRMVNNFKRINAIMADMYDETPTEETKKKCESDFVGCMKSMYDILMEYFKSVMVLEKDVLTLEWLKNNISDDNSYILADRAGDDEIIPISICERDSYIQKEYVNILLELQDLVKSSEDFEIYIDFYDSNLEYVIGCAKMLMYHAEDLEDLIACENAELKGGVPLNEFIKMIRDNKEDSKEKEE